MYHHISFFITGIIAITCNMLATIDDLDFMPLLSQLTTDNRARETSAND
ncbi:hypothetical protein M621_08200 [Serratia plymuthica S13]|uniref:Uncharacterized protein n=1 Tax=Serratia plymuthica S13 TaxID=1348660 RepID=S4YQG0_SERPL|nr:hypothetical protein M621_08200 [Serratia plymuthica S13]